MSKTMQGDRDCSWVRINEGYTALFWSDHWKLGQEVNTLQSRYPRLFSYAKDPWITVKELFETQDIYQNFHLPLSAQAYEDMINLQSLMESHNRVPGSKDVWFWQGSSKEYKPKIFLLSYLWF